MSPEGSTGIAAPLLNDPDLLRQQCYVNGHWIDGDAGSPLPVTDPATGETVARVPQLSRAQVRAAIDHAAAAWADWRGRTAKQRADVLRDWYRRILAAQDDFALLMTREQGKPLAEAKGEVAYGASFVEWFAEEGKRVHGDTIPTHAEGKRILVTREPIGVTAAITPWNFPVAMITRKVAPALAAGCPVVVKPAPQTPLCALALAELAHRAGVPAGILNVVCGDEIAVGQELSENPKVRKLSFTGSTEVGRILMRQCADTVKNISLELGGNAPFIVFDDADLDAAVEGLMQSKYRNSGQTCVCANRVYVQDGVYDAFTEKLVERVRDLKVGPGTEPDVAQGPLIDTAALEKVEAHIADATAKGAHIALGGEPDVRGGTFFQPTVLTDVHGEMRLAREETFGPVAPLFRFHDDDEAVREANDTEYGLAAYFYSRDLGRVWRVSEALEYGMLGINTGHISTEVAPFGGVKQSGIGREGSKYGIEAFLEMKYICLSGL